MCGVELCVWNLHLSHSCQIRHSLSLLIRTWGEWWHLKTEKINTSNKSYTKSSALETAHLYICSTMVTNHTTHMHHGFHNFPQNVRHIRIISSTQNSQRKSLTLSKEIIKKKTRGLFVWKYFVLQITPNVHNTNTQFTTKSAQASSVIHNTERKASHPHQFPPETEAIPHFNHRNTVAWPWILVFFSFFFYFVGL